jgi:uncharacterized protein YheU (UPF0270 family)
MTPRSTYILYWLRKKPSRATGKHQKEREGRRGRRSKKKMVVEDGTDNGKERQEEEVRDRKPTIKRTGTATMVLTMVKEYLESMRRQEKAQEEC